jgi:hypothetical protein
MAIGIIGAAGTSIGFGYGQSGSEVLLSGFGNGLSQSASRFLDRTNQLPTVTVPPGTRVRMRLLTDTQMPIYQEE